MQEYQNLSKSVKKKLKEEFDHCVRAKTELKKINVGYNMRIKEVQDELSSEKERAFRAENNRRELEMELNLLKSQVDRKIQELEDTLKEVQEAGMEELMQNFEFKVNYENMVRTIGKLETSSKGLQQHMVNLLNEKKQMKLQKDRLQSDLSHQIQNVKLFELEHEDLNSQIETLSSRVAAKEEQLLNFQTEIGQALQILLAEERKKDEADRKRKAGIPSTDEKSGLKEVREDLENQIKLNKAQKERLDFLEDVLNIVLEGDSFSFLTNASKNSKNLDQKGAMEEEAIGDSREQQLKKIKDSLWTYKLDSKLKEQTEASDKMVEQFQNSILKLQEEVNHLKVEKLELQAKIDKTERKKT